MIEGLKIQRVALVNLQLVKTVQSTVGIGGVLNNVQ